MNIQFDYFAASSVAAAGLADKSTCNKTSSFMIEPPAPTNAIPKSLRLIPNS